MEKTPNGIRYTYDLSYSGGHYILYANAHTKQEIKEAKSYLRNSFDVVSLRLASIEDKAYLFKSDVFKDPRTKPLKWYEINDSESLLKQAVLENWTVDFYVENHVLPCVKETREANIKRFGIKKIYL